MQLNHIFTYTTYQLPGVIQISKLMYISLQIHGLQTLWCINMTELFRPRNTQVLCMQVCSRVLRRVINYMHIYVITTDMKLVFVALSFSVTRHREYACANISIHSRAWYCQCSKFTHPCGMASAHVGVHIPSIQRDRRHLGCDVPIGLLGSGTSNWYVRLNLGEYVFLTGSVFFSCVGCIVWACLHT